MTEERKLCSPSIQTPQLSHAVPACGDHGGSAVAWGGKHVGHAGRSTEDTAQTVSVAAENANRYRRITGAGTSHVPHTRVSVLVSGQQKSARHGEAQGGYRGEAIADAVGCQRCRQAAPVKESNLGVVAT